VPNNLFKVNILLNSIILTLYKLIMNSKLTHNGYSVPNNSKTLADIKKDLVVKPFALPDYDFNNKPFPVYRRSEKFIYLPKYYGIEKYGQPKITNEREGHNISIEFKGTLRETQLSISKNVIETLNTKGSTVLSIPCGSGKTILGLYIASKIAKKTLVIVHKEFLLNQWIERIHQFLPTARVGRIQQNIIDIEDKDIVIAMLQSITVRKEGYPTETFDSFGITLIDECHRICSKTFSKALFQISTSKMLGLSATPDRKDGLSKVLCWFLGEFTVPNIQKDELSPEIRTVVAEYINPPTITYNMLGKVNLPGLVTSISLDPTRNLQIIKEIIESNKQGRYILVLSERRQQCTDLLNLLPNNVSGGLYVGGMKSADLDISNTKDVVFATYSMANEGYDNSRLDTLIMATGRSDIEQACGRILRKKNLNTPLIIDFQDEIEGLCGQAKKRECYYRKKKYKFLNGKKNNKDKTDDMKTFMFLED